MAQILPGRLKGFYQGIVLYGNNAGFVVIRQKRIMREKKHVFRFCLTDHDPVKGIIMGVRVLGTF